MFHAERKKLKKQDNFKYDLAIFPALMVFWLLIGFATRSEHVLRAQLGVAFGE